MVRWQTKDEALTEIDTLGKQIDALYWQQDALVHYANSGRIGDPQMDEGVRQAQIAAIEMQMNALIAQKNLAIHDCDTQFGY